MTIVLVGSINKSILLCFVTTKKYYKQSSLDFYEVSFSLSVIAMRYTSQDNAN